MYAMENTKKTMPVAFIALGLAVCVFLYLTFLHFGLKMGTHVGQSVCSINSKFNCEAVALSPYSELLGTPIALWGALFNGLILILLAGYAVSASQSLGRWATTLSLAGVVASVVMGFISITKMSTFCIFCISGYALSLITFFCLWKLSPKLISGSDIKELFSSNVKVLVGLVMVPALAFLITDMNVREYKQATRSLLISSIQEWKENPVRDFSEFTGIKFGPDDAKAKIVEFADYLCPHCAVAAPVLTAFAMSHPGVQLIFYPFPLDSQCNPVVEMSDGGIRCTLAKATLCVEKQGANGWDAYHWAFDHFGDKSILNISELSKMLNLNETELQTCIDSVEVAKAISTNGTKAKEFGVQGTPTVFVNGKMLPGGNMFMVLETLYNQL